MIVEKFLSNLFPFFATYFTDFGLAVNVLKEITCEYALEAYNSNFTSKYYYKRSYTTTNAWPYYDNYFLLIQEFFIPPLVDGFSLGFKWLPVSLSLKDSSQYSDRS